MALRPLTIGGTASDKQRFQTSARSKIRVILLGRGDLLNVKNGKKYLAQIMEFDSTPGELEQWKLNRIDWIYEKMWKGAKDKKGNGFESYEPLKRKGDFKY